MIALNKYALLTVITILLSVTLVEAQNWSGESVLVQQDPGSDQAQGLTPIIMRNRGQNGSTYQWNIYTAAVGGGYGVKPNAFEVWEYPSPNVNSNCCIQRFSIDKSISNNSANPVFIDSNGGLALGGYLNANGNMLSVNGNVGFGTNDNHGYRLAVNGNIHTKEVNVDANNWPDYVFKRTYKPIGLNLLKNYIDKNRHLPEIPSEKDVAINGVNLGEMNKTLLKKVEELTLYLIEKDKQYFDLKKMVILTNRSQQKQINLLKSKLQMQKFK